MTSPPAETTKPHRVGADWPFYATLIALGAFYLILIVGMLIAQGSFTKPDNLLAALNNREIRYCIKLSLMTCTVTAILSLWVAVPTGYLLSRYDFRGKQIVDTLLDIPIVLPPLVIGISLLILFNRNPVGRWMNEHFGLTHQIAGVILAQFMVACAFAVRTMRVTFDQISPRQEQVALTLGCSRNQAFWMVVMPEAQRGILAAGTLAWARSMGEFGPIMIFAGATPMHTDVMPTRTFLEFSVGDIEVALALSIMMVLMAAMVLPAVRLFGYDPSRSPMKKPR